MTIDGSTPQNGSPPSPSDLDWLVENFEGQVDLASARVANLLGPGVSPKIIRTRVSALMGCGFNMDQAIVLMDVFTVRGGVL